MREGKAKGMATCSACGRSIDTDTVYCRCTNFVGFPNVRAALDEQNALQARYLKARQDCRKRGVANVLNRLETIAGESQPAITMSYEACDGLLRSKKYQNYNLRLEASLRGIAAPVDHADRESVGVRLYPGYHRHLAYAALSPDGRGLENYGKVVVLWAVTPEYLGKRSSLLEENSYAFYNRHGLGTLGAVPPGGFRSTWKDRAKLVAAKLASRLTVHTGPHGMKDMILNSGNDRHNDDFVEIVIYDETGVDVEDVNSVRIQNPPSTQEEHHRLELIRGSCLRLEVRVVQR